MNKKKEQTLEKHVEKGGQVDAIVIPRVVREQLAEYAHGAWSGWMKYLFEKTIPYKPGEIQASKGALIIPQWAVERWTRQMTTEYNCLSESEKESDRQEADKIIAIIEVVQRLNSPAENGENT